MPDSIWDVFKQGFEEQVLDRCRSVYLWTDSVVDASVNAIKRLDNVKDIFSRSFSLSGDLITQRFSEFDISAIKAPMIEMVKEIAWVYGLSVGGLTVAGGAIGSLAGGVGAAPGAVLGAKAGVLLGTAISTFFGIKDIIESISEGEFAPIIEHYDKGFAKAWAVDPRVDVDNLPYQRAEQGNLIAPISATDMQHMAYEAENEMAEGHILLFGLLLIAILTVALRGKGAKLAKVARPILNWAEKNKHRLDDLRLNVNRKNGGVGDGAGGGTTSPFPLDNRTPSNNRHGSTGAEPNAHKHGDKADETKPPVVAPMKKVDVPCFPSNPSKKSGLSSSDYHQEFDRQLDGQMKGMNNLTVDEYIQGRDAYKNWQQDKVNNPSPRGNATGRDARKKFETELIDKLTKINRTNGMSRAQAEAEAVKEAASKMKTLAALHNPDLIAGGKDVITDMGNKNINSAIGTQWKNEVPGLTDASGKPMTRLDVLDQAANAIPASERGKVKMNANLKRCR